MALNYLSRDIKLTDPRFAALAADKPFFCSRNTLENSQVNNAPRWNSTGSLSDADISWVGYAAYCACDGSGSRPTMANPALDTHHSFLTSATDLFLMFDQKPKYLSRSNKADALIVQIQNLVTLIQAGVTISYEVANNAAFSSGLVQVAAWNASALTGQLFGNLYTPNYGKNGRLYCYQLDDGSMGSLPAEYNRVQYSRLRFTGATGVFASIIPVVLEVYFGPKTVLTIAPTLNSKVPLNMRSFDPVMGKVEAMSGQRSDVIFAESRTMPSPGWSPFDPGLQPDFDGSVDNGVNLLSQHQQAHHGTRSFYFCLNPNTHPEFIGLYKLDNSKFGLDQIEGISASALPPAPWAEQPPYLDDEQVAPFKISQCFNFQNQNDRYYMTPGPTTTIDFPSTGMTWMGWARSTGTPPTLGNIMAHSNGAGPWIVGYNNGWDELTLRTGNGGDTIFWTWDVGGLTALGPWAFWAITWGAPGASNQVKAYWNGTAVSLHAGSPAATPTHTMSGDSPALLTIGGLNVGPGTNGIAPAELSNVAIVNRELSATEILALSGTPKDLTYLPGLVSWWIGNGTSEDTIGDNDLTQFFAIYAPDHP